MNGVRLAPRRIKARALAQQRFTRRPGPNPIDLAGAVAPPTLPPGRGVAGSMRVQPARPRNGAATGRSPPLSTRGLDQSAEARMAGRRDLPSGVPKHRIGTGDAPVGAWPGRDHLSAHWRKPGPHPSQSEINAATTTRLLSNCLADQRPARPSMACSSTLPPASIHSGVASSTSLWLMPSTQGTKTMAVGATLDR